MVLPFGLGTVPRVFTFLTRPHLFLCLHRGFVLLFTQMISWVFIHSKCASRRSQSFLCSLLVCLGLGINFSKPETLSDYISLLFGTALEYGGYVHTSYT